MLHKVFVIIFVSILYQSPHPHIPTCGQSLRFSCHAAEGVTEECTLRVLLLTQDMWGL